MVFIVMYTDYDIAPRIIGPYDSHADANHAISSMKSPPYPDTAYFIKTIDAEDPSTLDQVWTEINES